MMSLISKSTFPVAILCLLTQTAFAADESGTTTTTKPSSSAKKRPAVKVAQPEQTADQNIRTKLSKDDAEKIALQNVQGDIVSSKLDSVAGNPCYTFDIKSGGSVKTVLVDATSGQVVIVGN
jgi:uncharacterized membrane protein YkoI